MCLGDGSAGKANPLFGIWRSKIASGRLLLLGIAVELKGFMLMAIRGKRSLMVRKDGKNAADWGAH